MEYPYLPKGRTLILINSENRFMREATKLLGNSGCAKQATGAAVVKNGKIVGCCGACGGKIKI
jgi:deoxycytidylate deaminase